jgi:hypothetical protein
MTLAMGFEHFGRLYSFSFTVVSAIALVETAAMIRAILDEILTTSINHMREFHDT